MPARGPPPALAVGLISVAALAYEVLLTRLFAIVQWHHAAYMVISLALLGYGASGTFLAIAGDRARRRCHGLFAAGALLFGPAAAGGFLLVQHLPFNVLEAAWSPAHWGLLVLDYLLLALPFFCAATAIGAALMSFPGAISRLYAFDLAGAGLGAAGLVALLFAVAPMAALVAVAALGMLAAPLVLRRWYCWAAPAVAGLVWLALPPAWVELQLSEFKGLSRALRTRGAEVVAERSSPLGSITVVRNDRVPRRSAPGLSLAAGMRPPPQLGVFVDGEPAGSIVPYDGDPASVAYLDQVGSALPYHLWRGERGPRVLVLGAGGGEAVLQAVYHGARRIDALELDPQLVSLVRDRFDAYSGGIYRRPEVRVEVGEARAFLARSEAAYDLIQHASLGGFGTAASGLSALNEGYLYTVEAMEAYLDHLEPGGLVSFTRWLRAPPRDVLKLLAAVVAALERRGVADPAARVVLIRGWQTATLVVKDGAFGAAEIAALRDFCEARAFDLAYHPGLEAADANRYHLQPQRWLFEGAAALLGPGREAFLRDYKLDLRPATDDRPFHDNFFRWGSLPELLAQPAGGGLGQLDWGYLAVVATLAQALVLGLLLILLPLAIASPARAPRAARWRVLGYFTAIGLAFLMLELAFIQKLVLFLGHPLYAVAVVLSAFLVFAGLGSALSRRLRAGPWLPVLVIALLCTLYAWCLGPALEEMLAWPEPARLAAAVALVGPLALAMGMPFPMGLGRVAATAPVLVPWAWGINGCASVVSAALAVLLAVELGFWAVLAIAVGCYAIAALCAPRPAA